MKKYKIQDGLCVLALVICACKPPSITEDDGGNEDALLDACRQFCERAVGCAEEFSQYIDMDTRDSCMESCVTYTQDYVETFERPECTAPLTALWQCGGQIQDCETFQAFEDDAHNVSAFSSHPCKEEVARVLDGCT